MASHPILSWIPTVFQTRWQIFVANGGVRPKNVLANLTRLAEHPEHLPGWVQSSPTAMRYLTFLAPLAWESFPERPLSNPAHEQVMPWATFAAACLVKLEEGLPTLARLHRFLLEHPALIWLLGFPLKPARTHWGFDPQGSLPAVRHFSRTLRGMPNDRLQALLDSSVTILSQELEGLGILLGDVISLDTKHILAWVKENNPKASVSDRFDKTKQPKGDPDCKLGCKRRHNRPAETDALPATPAKEGIPARSKTIGEFYWGYASGVVATKAGDWGEFVLAELTQTFDKPDISYFEPLMAATERRLGRRPRFGALDAAFDAFYVYEYFHNAGGFAAVPWSDRPSHRKQFSAEGLPLCAAGLPMPKQSSFIKRSHCLTPHRRIRYACPLKYPEKTGRTCPIQHKNWAKKGCITTLPDSPGVRVRHELDRQGEAYKEIFRQRTATERINSQALELGIERPKLRNARAIANINTLIYVLINLRAYHRIRQRRADLGL